MSNWTIPGYGWLQVAEQTKTPPSDDTWHPSGDSPCRTGSWSLDGFSAPQQRGAVVEQPCLLLWRMTSIWNHHFVVDISVISFALMKTISQPNSYFAASWVNHHRLLRLRSCLCLWAARAMGSLFSHCAAGFELDCHTWCAVCCCFRLFDSFTKN